MAVPFPPLPWLNKIPELFSGKKSPIRQVGPRRWVPDAAADGRSYPGDYSPAEELHKPDGSPVDVRNFTEDKIVTGDYSPIGAVPGTIHNQLLGIPKIKQAPVAGEPGVAPQRQGPIAPDMPPPPAFQRDDEAMPAPPPPPGVLDQPNPGGNPNAGADAALLQRMLDQQQERDRLMAQIEMTKALKPWSVERKLPPVSQLGQGLMVAGHMDFGQNMQNAMDRMYDVNKGNADRATALKIAAMPVLAARERANAARDVFRRALS